MENYKEKYEQALERAKVINPGTADYEVVAKIFPELKESEDKRIRKALLNEFIHLQSKGYKFAGLEGEEIITWLEKQGEKVDAIENFNTEFERQISHLIASTINKEHEYNEDFVKWTANTLLNYAKHELEKKELKKIEPFKQKPVEWSEKDEKMFKSVISSIRISRSSCEEDDDVRDLFDNEIDWLESLKERIKET